jgi:hypothetical protein
VLESVGIGYLYRAYLCFVTGEVCLLTVDAFFRGTTLSMVFFVLERKYLVAALNFAYKH